MTNQPLAVRIKNLTAEQRSRLAVSVARHLPPGRRSLHAFFTSEHSDVDVESLNRKAIDLLPATMRPRSFTRLERLPRTASGKVDRKSLSRHAPGSTVMRASGVSSQPVEDDLLEMRLLSIWRECLSQPDLTSNDNFFESGGDSLDVIRVLALCAEQELRLTPSEFSDRPTVKSQAAFLNQEAAASPATPTQISDELLDQADREVDREEAGNVIFMNSAGSGPPLFLFPPKCHAAGSFRHVVSGIRQFSCYSPVILSDQLEDGRTVEDVVPEFLNQVRRIQPAGPYRFVGNCEGAFVAWELACQLREAGEAVEILGILDTPNPQGFREKPLGDRVRSRLSNLRKLSPWRILPSLAVRAAGWLARQTRARLANDPSISRPGTHMGWAFSPRSYDGHVVLFRCTRPGTSDFKDLEIDVMHGWEAPATSGLNVVALPISRDELFEESTGAMLSEKVETAVLAARSSGRLSRDHQDVSISSI